MASITEFCAEHRELERQARMLLDVVALEIPDPASVAALRWGFAQTLRDHCAGEDYAIYDVLLASGDVAATRTAWAQRQEHGALSAAFATYIAQWSVGRMASEWPLFCAETRAMLARMLDRIESEETILFAEAERVFARRKAA
ncbi:hemerythrin domain-containing protein [Sphingomonas hengshuiensis]|uniref:hemerythrin domain-containing protein n=1 Tax=Sphingomonas hengshuiensis TaxID=1609977 RepID=UPI00069859F5|nr:hemerythrin domain-containing protein [Sphingomonas hengshuiensis]